MNSEINFMKKQPKKHTTFLWTGILSLILLIIVSGVIVLQKNNLQSEIESLESKRAQIESVLMENQDRIRSDRVLQQLRQEVMALEAEMFPAVALYKETLQLLQSPGNLIGYDFSTENQFTTEAEFTSLQEVANYLRSLEEKAYITDSQLNSAGLYESMYQATLTVTVDREILIEELGDDA
ncbi:hypothetical protein [Oceanobacillus salinisoli]|uniref:hypothetical protein n=1 Tax=Oceanobacillus salinisoli TaxID=2678611 RepID=UPI0012E238FF|nr:hypothetical protein [Oceanobacillus salinisoli]